MSEPLDLLLQDEHVMAFAHATGDVNPLHVSPDFARRTPYGRPIAHGALGCLAALTARGVMAEELPGPVTVQFRRPMFTGRRYVVQPLERRADGWSVTVTDAGDTAMRIRAGRPPASVRRPSTPVASAHGGPASWQDEYRLLDPAGLRVLLGQWGHGVPEPLLLPLSWASWFTGMVVPGREALLSQIVAPGLSDGDGVLSWSATLTRDDLRFGSVVTSTSITAGDAQGRVDIESFRRSPAPRPTRSRTESLLPRSTRLSGRHVLVVGGSRGIGAALSAALVSQGATVHVGYARSDEQVVALRAEFGVERIRAAQMDATDPDSVRTVVASLTASDVALDGVVLCAAPAVQGMPLHADTAAEALDHVGRAVAMTWLPLTECLPLLSRGSGWVVILSSAWLEDPPSQFAHYAAAKGALEGLATAVARHEDLAVLLVRPPRVWTDLTNGPGGALGAIDPGSVAAEVARWVTSAPAPSTSPAVLGPTAFEHPDRPRLPAGSTAV